MEKRIDVVMDEEMKKKLDGFVAFELIAPFKYTPAVYVKNAPREIWPIFTLRSKGGLEIAQIEDESGYVTYDPVSGQRVLKFQSGKQRIVTLQRGIVAVENLRTEDGGRIDWNNVTKCAKITSSIGEVEKLENTDVDYIIDRLPPMLQVELQEAINERKTISDEELLSLES